MIITIIIHYITINQQLTINHYHNHQPTEAAEAEAEADADPATASSKAQARFAMKNVGQNGGKRGKNVIFDDFLWCLMIFFEETWSNKCDFMVIEPTNRGDLSHTRISAKNMRMKVISTANMWEWLRIYATKIRDIQRHWDGSIPLWAWKPFYRRKYFFFDEQKGTAVLKLFWGNVFWGNVTKGIWLN